MHNRIKDVRKALGINQTDFGAKIGVKQGSVAAYENGSRSPLDSVIVSICREFNVNELWLREGVGEMFRPMSRNEKLASFFGDVLADKPEAFRVRLCAALAELDEAEWEVAEKFFKNLAGQ